MSYHSKLLVVSRKLNKLKIRTVSLLGFILLMWVLNSNISTNVWITVIFGVWSGLTIIDIVKFTKLQTQYKKLAEKEDKDLKDRMNEFFSKRRYTQKDLNDLFDELLNEMLNEHFKQSQHQQNFVKPPNREKLDNAYKLMRLNKTDSVETIKKKYKMLAIKWHPDKWSTSTEQNKAIALRNFKKLQAAYDLIKKDKNIV